MNIGYACLNIGIENSKYKTFRKNNFTEELYLNTIKNNLEVLEDTIKYNISNDIKLFRISSDLIPFGSDEDINIPWDKIFIEDINRIRDLTIKSDIRVSMHPGQYTVINSNKEEVVDKSIKDLEYHNKVLDLLTVDNKSKIILHIGGVYGDKNASKKRFIHNFKKIDEKTSKRIVIENDDKLYNIMDVLEISKELNIPVVFDNLHNDINKSEISLSDKEIINLCKDTWSIEDGQQKMHYSQQAKNKRIGAHSSTIDLKLFNNYIEENELEDIDIMLEVKDKNLSCIKCNNLIRKGKNIKYLEIEWSKYKYNVLEHSHKDYLAIRELLKDKSKYPVLDFYDLIDKALMIEINMKDFENAANHVWGYFKKIASDEERSKYERYLLMAKEGKYKKETLKKYLLSLSRKYEIEYIYNSLYAYI